MKLLTLDETAEVLRLDKRSVLKIIESGVLPAMKAGVAPNSPWRISEKALFEYIKRESAKAGTQAVRQ